MFEGHSATGPRPRVRLPGVALQAMLLLAAGGIAFVPPATGAMLAIPIGGGDAVAVDRLIEHSGATMLGVGPLRGSRYLSGDRAALVGPALAQGILLVAGDPSLCSGSKDASQ